MKKVFVKSNGQGKYCLKELKNDNSIVQIDGFFNSEQEALNFAKKQGYKIIDYKEDVNESKSKNNLGESIGKSFDIILNGLKGNK